MADDKNLRLTVMTGPLTGRVFHPDASGMRLGRSSSCEISIPDPSLSRNQCLFELREGALWVTDLASANGTLLNDEELGATSRRIQDGDRITAGDTVVVVGDPPIPGQPAPSPAAAGGEAASVTQDIDLGFASSHGQGAGAPAPAPGAGSAGASRRFLLWATAGIVVGGAALFVLFDPGAGSRPGARSADAAVPALSAADAERLVSLSYERVQADGSHIFRYSLELDRNGILAVSLDDVPAENRHLPVKRVTLSAEARTRLQEVFASPDFFRLDARYEGGGAQPGEYARTAFRVIRAGDVFETVVENAPEPPAFAAVRDRLEAFSRNELGIWAMSYPTEKLVAMSQEDKNRGDAKWAERDVRESNLAAAIKAYDSAVGLLETVNPKPAFFEALCESRRQAIQERNARYGDRRFAADRAIKLGDWQTARTELRVLMELVPEASDERHREASAKLLDVERRLSAK